MGVVSPGRLSRLGICFASTLAGFAYATLYVWTESRQFSEPFFAAFILRTIHAFFTGTFAIAALLYRSLGNSTYAEMIRERHAIVYWFVILAGIHMIPPLLRAPSALLTWGTALFLLSSFVTLRLAGGWDAAINIGPKAPSTQPDVRQQR